MSNVMTDIFGPVVYSYTRKQAIEDGVLVDASDLAKEAGIKFPVAMTRAVYEDCVKWDEKANKRQTYQDESGRMWDVICMLGMAIRRAEGSRINYSVLRVPYGGRARTPKLVNLKAVCGPGDDVEPVITIMQPDED